MDNNNKFQTAMNEIWLDDEGILWLMPIESGEIDLEEAKACFKIYKSMGCDKKKVLQLMDMRNSVTISKDARDFAAKEGNNYFIASAIVSNTLAVRIMVNFFNKFYKPEVPFKLFGDIESALKWLRTFKN